MIRILTLTANTVVLSMPRADTRVLAASTVLAPGIMPKACQGRARGIAESHDRLPAVEALSQLKSLIR
jgi:hypothetical protein